MYSLVRYRACLALTRPMRMRIDIWFTSSSYLHMTSNLFAKKKNELLFKDAIRGMAKKKKKKLGSDEHLSACGTVHLRHVPTGDRLFMPSSVFLLKMNEMACTFEKPML